MSLVKLFVLCWKGKGGREQKERDKKHGETERVGRILTLAVLQRLAEKKKKSVPWESAVKWFLCFLVTGTL